MEAALRNVLDGWIVDNQADAQLLRVSADRSVVLGH